LAQLIKFTLHRGRTVQTEISLMTAGIHCTTSQRLSGAMEDCSTVRVQQPRTLCRQKRCMSPLRRMNAAADHEHRRQDGSRRPGTMAKCQTTTGERTWRVWLTEPHLSFKPSTSNLSPSLHSSRAQSLTCFIPFIIDAVEWVIPSYQVNALCMMWKQKMFGLQ